MNKKQLGEFYSLLTDELDISDSLFEKAIESYTAVGEYIDNNLEYDIEVYEQGSFSLGTVVRPVNDEDDYDIDLVCEIHTKQPISANETKICVGDVLENSKRYASKLTEKKRCWRIDYADKAQFHMDIAPMLVVKGEGGIAQITTKKDNGNYIFSPSNPKGYAEWFHERNNMVAIEMSAQYLNEAVQEVEQFKRKKPLQRVIQILKRHRDIMFADCAENAPISVVISTLAAHAYNGEQSLFDALETILNNMAKFVYYDGENYEVANPTVDEENFTASWKTEPQKAQAFYKWLKQVKTDLLLTSASVDNFEYFESILGEAISLRAITVLESASVALTESVASNAVLNLPLVKATLAVSHRQKLPYKEPSKVGLKISAKITTADGKAYRYNSNEQSIPTYISVHF